MRCYFKTHALRIAANHIRLASDKDIKFKLKCRNGRALEWSGCRFAPTRLASKNNHDMKKTDYIVILAPMVTELGLSGNRLVIYALIHGFSKDGVNEFKGSISYICDWTNLSRNTVLSTLKSLVEDGLIEKHENIVNGVKFCSYKVTDSSFAPPVQKLHQGGSAEIAPHPNTNGSNDSKEEEKENKKKKKSRSIYDDAEFNAAWDAYRRKGSKVEAFRYWKKLTDEEKKQAMPHIKAYAASRELVYQKDFERYLRDKTFNQIIIDKRTSNVIYDPTRFADGGYHPTIEANGRLSWMDDRKCYVYVGMFFGDIYDGYTDDNRPSGAKVLIGNGGYFVTWNGETKKWER